MSIFRTMSGSTTFLDGEGVTNATELGRFRTLETAIPGLLREVTDITHHEGTDHNIVTIQLRKTQCAKRLRHVAEVRCMGAEDKQEHASRASPCIRPTPSRLEFVNPNKSHYMQR